MIKKISILIMIVAVISGGIVMWFKTQSGKENQTTVLGSTIALNYVATVTQTPETPIVTDIPLSTATPTIQTVQKGPYPMEIDTKKQYTAVLKTTAGDITIAFTASATPITVNNFIALARRNFYDNTVFHRVIKGFMIQGGDPTGTGSGGPGYSFADEPFTGEYTRGTVAMANAGPNTNGSQFFIMHADNALPKSYVIFGHVTNGMDVVDTIATASTKPEGEGSTPIHPVSITSVQIVEQ
jgi:cyclophilin family peptidyl-prolyl cis-trans isomerase